MDSNFFEHIKSNSESYQEFRKRYLNAIEQTNLIFDDPQMAERHEFTKLNYHRINRLEKTYSPSEEIKTIIEQIKEPQHWLIISTAWCGDSAQNIPALVKIAELQPLIKLYIVERDEHPEIMDAFLTDGKRSIPKLIAFDDSGRELFNWGSRPAPAQQLVMELKSQGAEKKEWEEKLHLWYARDKGKTLESEIIPLLQKTLQLKETLQ